MLILASASPRRRELLSLITSNFIIKESNVDESELGFGIDNENLAKELSYLKANAIFQYHPDDTVLGCDTVVLFENQVLGKPIDREDAKRMLHLLSGKTHRVITGFTIISKEMCISRSVETLVTFNKLSEEDINSYVATGSPLDKAGAYGIQDRVYKIVECIEGSFYNVMGLPVEELTKYLLK